MATPKYFWRGVLPKIPLGSAPVAHNLCEPDAEVWIARWPVRYGNV